ncbi:SUMO-interacting motif-containing protein 1 isoform X2 [Myiozetetes cayanensis]|uniref:SUMO-interacting motif-containing protein 1 isoform X2 n=1 Tax=Myiozetetes cayanensis TaxID=478635 RepID=UPI0021607D6D|nr:SUMO-interacting motif-containing protein 1 isoform X2 [Myiozetetes cayanensis]
MDDTVVLLSDSDSEGARSPPLPPPRPRRPSRSLPAPAEVIDLTCEDTSTDPTRLSVPENIFFINATEDIHVLHCTCSADQDPRTAPAAPAAHTSHPRLCFTPEEEMEAEPSPAPPWHSTPVKPSATTDTAESTENRSCHSPASSCHSSCSSEQDCSATSFNSDLGSLTSMQLDSDLLSLSPPSLDSNSSWKADGPEEKPPPLCQERDLPPRLSPAPALSITPGKAQGPLLETNDLLPHEPTQQVTPARSDADSKAWLDKLHSFRRSGVQHLFFQGIAPNQETQQKPELIPRGKLSMVRTTMEENFLEGTLHLLNEFVSCQHCPPKDIISHLIRQVLLNAHEEEILKDTYMLLMKIQMLHPANAATVGWDWTLLKFIMEDQVLGTVCVTSGQGSSRTQCLREKPPGRLLFLQYVVQTLEDDLQKNLRLHLLQKSIAKKVLSCDVCFNNVKEVVKWLVAAITGVGFCQPQEQPQETPSSSAEARAEHSSSSPSLASTQAPAAFFAQKVMLLLQRMLFIAVEVDRSPTCSSRRIADEIFPFILNIPLRRQRETLLNTMESQLLRCRLLELLFQHSCDVPSTSSMSLEKILYFLSHCSVQLHFEDETATWQRWDEMLQYLSLLLMSYQSVIREHLRSSLSDRMDLIVQRAKPRLQESDNITNLDIQLKMEDFISRMQEVLGQPFPPQIQEKLFLLQELFFIVATA